MYINKITNNQPYIFNEIKEKKEIEKESRIETLKKAIQNKEYKIDLNSLSESVAHKLLNPEDV